MPAPGFVGTDSFPYHVWDGYAWSNTATVSIVVALEPITSPQLFFGGYDDSSAYNLWTYDGVNPIQAIPGSAVGMSAIGMKQVLEGVTHNNKIYFIGTDASFEATFVFSFDPVTGQYQPVSQFAGGEDLEVYNGALYVGGNVGTGNTAYLWSDNGADTWAPIAGTDDIFPYYLTPYSGKLYFSGESTQGTQLWSYNNTNSTLTSETSIGTDLQPRDLTVCNGKLYFNGTFGTVASYEYLWSIDGSSAATTVTNSVSSPENMICFNNELYFTAKGAPGSTMPVQLWSLSNTDVLTRWTSNATVDFMGTYSDTYPVVLGSDLYLRGTDDSFTNWIWAHDGSSALTTVSGSSGFYPFETVTYDNRLFFRSSVTAYDQLWSYDPATDNLTQMSTTTMGLYPKGLMVYTP